MQGDEELIIEITPDEPVVETTEAKSEKIEKTEKVETVQIEPIEDLRKQLETLQQEKTQEKNARVNAERLAEQSIAKANEALEEVAKAKTEVVDREMSALESAIEAAKTEADSAEQEYKIAFENGDGGKMALAQRKMARAEAKMQRLDEGKADLEVRRTERPEKPQKIERQAQADPFEKAIANVTPRSQAWLRQHPEYVKDDKLNRKANAAHNMALADGIQPDSDEYFDFCERFLGLKEEPKAEPKPEPKPRARALAAAPVSREAISMNGQLTPTQVPLSPGEQRSATDGTIVWNYDDPKVGAKRGEPIGLREMARRKLSLQKQGAYDRSYTES